MRAVVLADTHIRRGGKRRLPDLAYAAHDAADVVLHAGDLVIEDLLHELRGCAPTYAVLGNNDIELAGCLPETRCLDLAGVPVAMIHDSGPRKGRESRMKRRFPGADVVVFGHSHIPVNGPGLDGQLLFNPGSPTDKRVQPHFTIGILDLVDGRVVDSRIEIVDP